MNIPVKIEIGCMVFVVLSYIDEDKSINVVEKWCKVIDIFTDSIKIEETPFRILLHRIEFFTFGGIILPNPDFNFLKIIEI